MHPRITAWQVATGLKNESVRRHATDQGPIMRNTARYPQEEIIEHLEKALALRDQASESVVGYLVERIRWMRRKTPVSAGLPKSARE
jgi:hypothetical protein